MSCSIHSSGEGAILPLAGHGRLGTAWSLLSAELVEGRQVCVHSAGASMRPHILPGDILTVEPIMRIPFRPGDIVLIDTGEEWIVHRLLAIWNTNGRACAVTRGDAVNRLDVPVPLDSIRGTVIRARRGDRELSLESTCLIRCKARLSLLKLVVLGFLRRLCGDGDSIRTAFSPIRRRPA